VLGLAVLAALLAAPPADTVLRVPGTALRFGLADSVVAVRGFTPAGADARDGRCRFFGLDAAVRLDFARGRLSRAEILLEGLSPHQRDYVQDQLTAMGYRRVGERLGTRAGECRWEGAVRLQLIGNGGKLQVVATPPPAPVPPLLPDTLHVREPDRLARRSEAVVLAAPPCAAPPDRRPDGAPPRVRVLLLVDTDGTVLEATVIRGLPTLDPAALDCARGWRFEPRTWQGAPCRFRVEVPITVSFD